MIVALYDDYAVNLTADALSKQNPGEARLSIDQFLLAVEDNALVEEDGSTPERISFVSHCGFTMNYWGLSANQFADNIKNQLYTAARQNPALLTSLKHIDLIGCHTGLVKDEVECVADIFAETMLQLENVGFQQIQVRSFTNRILEQPTPVHMMIVGINADTGNFHALLFRTIKDVAERQMLNIELERLKPILQDLNAEMKSLYPNYIPIETLYDDMDEAQKDCKVKIEKCKAILEENLIEIAEKKSKLEDEYQRSVVNLQMDLRKEAQHVLDNQQKLQKQKMGLQETNPMTSEINDKIAVIDARLLKLDERVEDIKSAYKIASAKKQTMLEQKAGILDQEREIKDKVNRKVEELKQTLTVIALMKKIAMVEKKIDATFIDFVTTADIRQELDRLPECNFTQRALELRNQVDQNQEKTKSALQTNSMFNQEQSSTAQGQTVSQRPSMRSSGN